MQKKLTITVDEQVYAGLHRVVGRQDLMAAYREMAADEAREAEAHEWVESMIADVADETR